MKEKILKQIVESKKNIIVGGESLVGKSECVIKPYLKNIVDSNESFIVLDSKEEYINEYYNLCKEKNYEVTVINLRNPEKSDGWNPLEIPYKIFQNGNKDKAYNYVKQLSKIIFYDNSCSDPFWNMTSGDFFEGIVFSIFEDAKENEINFNSVMSFLNAGNSDKTQNDIYVKYFKTKDENSLEYRCASATVFSPIETKKSIIATAKQKLKYLTVTDNLSKLLSKSVKKENELPKAVFIIGKDEESLINDLVVMYVSQIFTNIIEEKKYKKFNIILDNFDTINYFDGLIDILGSSVYRNVRFILATRSIKKLEDTYGNYLNKICDYIEIKNEDFNYSVDYEKKLLISYSYEINDDVCVYELKKNEDIKIFDIDCVIKKIDEKIDLLDKEEEKIIQSKTHKLYFEKNDTLSIGTKIFLRTLNVSEFRLSIAKALRFEPVPYTAIVLYYTLEINKVIYNCSYSFDIYNGISNKVDEKCPYTIKVSGYDFKGENPYLEFLLKKK